MQLRIQDKWWQSGSNIQDKFIKLDLLKGEFQAGLQFDYAMDPSCLDTHQLPCDHDVAFTQPGSELIDMRRIRVLHTVACPGLPHSQPGAQRQRAARPRALLHMRSPHSAQAVRQEEHPQGQRRRVRVLHASNGRTQHQYIKDS